MFSFSYDENGNVIRVVQTNLPTGSPDYRTTTYDGENRPVRVVRAGVETTFAFAPDGTRLRKVHPRCAARLSGHPVAPETGRQYTQTSED